METNNTLDKGKISIILPCYKGEKYVAGMMHDIIRQTYTNWELIVVSNGAGQEPQLEIINKIAREEGNGKIRVICEEQGGVSHARNIGLRAATGEWLTFADQDDRMDDNHFQLLMNAATDGEWDIVISGFGEDNKISKQKTIGVAYDLCGKKAKILAESAVWTKLFRTSFVRQSGILFPEDRSWGEDGFFTASLLLLTDRLKMISTVSYWWVKRSAETGCSRHHPMAERVVKEMKDLRCALMRQAGCTEEEIDNYRRTCNDGYNLVRNLYRVGSPLTLKEKHRSIQRIVFADADVCHVLDGKKVPKHDICLIVYLLTYRMKSAWCMALAFQLLYGVRNVLVPLYRKIATIE